jgi:hypothetical protein
MSQTKPVRVVLVGCGAVSEVLHSRCPLEMPWLAVREILPSAVVQAIKRPWNSLQAPQGHSVSASSNARPIPAIETEMFHLQRCRYVLPIRKAGEVLDYVPQVTFAEGCRRTGEWLRFAFGMDGGGT